jgi:hypothetical protein
MGFKENIIRGLNCEEGYHLRKMEQFSPYELTEYMLNVSGSSTTLTEQQFNKIKPIFDGLKKIRDALSLIQEIDKKQGIENPLTTKQEIFRQYFSMVSEYSMMRQSLADMNDFGNRKSIYNVNERDSFRLKECLDMRSSAWWSWFSNRWTTDCLNKSKRKSFGEIRRNRRFDDPEYIGKMREIRQEQTKFYESHYHENTSLSKINIDLLNQIKNHEQKINVPKLKSIFSLEWKDILDFLKLSEEEQHRKMTELKVIFDEIIPEFRELHDSYTSFVERCRVMTRINQNYMKGIEQDDGVVALYQFCEKNHLAFPGIQNEGDEEIPIPPKGERTDENMRAYYDKRKKEWDRMESERIELERKMKETSSK